MCYIVQMATRKAVKRVIRTAPKVKEVVAKQVVATPTLPDFSSIRTKLSQPRVFIGLIVVVLAVGAFFLKGLFVAAMVNGEPITRASVISELEKQGGKQALSSLVNQTLILQEAKKKNVQATQADVDASLKQIEDSLKSQGQNLDTALAMQGMTRQDLMMQLKLRTLVEKLLADKVKVSDKEIADYIDKNKANLPTNMTPEELNKTVTEQLKQQKLGTESQTWLADLNKNAKISYFVSY